MSLSARERKALDSIEGRLAGSAPELAMLMSAFNRLASDERMPDRERLRKGPRSALRRPPARRHSVRRGPYPRLSLQWIALVLWLLATAVLIATGITLGTSGGRSTCDSPMTVTCVSPASRHSPPSSPRSTGSSPATGSPGADVAQVG